MSNSKEQESSQPNVQIDEHALDKECLMLPTQYLKAAYKAAECKRDVDEAKNALEVIEAELAREVRADPKAFGLEKATNDAVKEVILMSKKFVAAQDEFNEATHEAQLAQAVVWAMEMKKRSLTMLVDLHGMGYFADVKPKSREALEEMTRKQSRRSVRKSDDED